MALCLGLPAGASAAELRLLVNSTADTPDVNPGDDICDADAGAPAVCTLRAAIEELNAQTDPSDFGLISFSGVIFDGGAGAKITLGSPLPALTVRAHIDSPTSCGTAEIPKPCTEVGYATSSATPVISIDGASSVLINGLAITNGSVGVLVEAKAAGEISNDFGLLRSWIGLHLDGSAGGNGIGVLLRGDRVDNAVIGGASEFNRNVISHNTITGIDVEDADAGEILGNYIGTKPEG